MIAQLLCNISQSAPTAGQLLIPDAIISTLALDGIPSITSISIPNATDADFIGIAIGQSTGMAGVVSVSAPSITQISGSDFSNLNSLQFVACPVLTSIDFPLLQTLAGNMVMEITGLTSISFPSLVSIGGVFYLDQNPALVSIDLPLMTTYVPIVPGSGIVASNCPNLSSFNAPNLVIPNINLTVVDFSGDALDQTSVEQILARGVASGLNVPVTIDLSGGTNFGQAGLSPAGAADLATLLGNGVTVLMNP